MKRPFILFVLLAGAALFVCAQTAPGQKKLERVDLLIRGGTVLTMDRDKRVIEDGAVAIRGDAIIAVGTSRDLAGRYAAAQSIDASGSVVMPGLVNGHAHAAMTLLRGLADDLAFREWLEKYIFPAEAKNVTEDFVAWGTRLGLVEMIRSGTTTYADMYYFEDAVARVTKEAGMRGVLGETIIDFPAPDNKTVPDALAYTEKYLQHWKGDALIHAAVAPHAPYTCSEKTLRDSAALARRYGAPILIHLAEAKFEVEQIKREHGLTPTAWLDQIGVLGPDVVAAHCIWMEPNDIQLIVASGAGCVHNPASNIKLTSGVMPIPEFLFAGARLGVGTDGPASNNAMDLMRDLRLASFLQKEAHGDPRVLTAQQVVEMATIGGARALHMENEIGSLENGKKADIIVVSEAAAHMHPFYNPYSELVYAASGEDVRDVVISGRVVMRNRRLLTLNEAEIYAKAKEYSARILKSLQPGD